MKDVRLAFTSPCGLCLALSCPEHRAGTSPLGHGAGPGRTTDAEAGPATREAGLRRLLAPFRRPSAVLGPAASAVPSQPELETPPFPNALRAAPENGVRCGEGAFPILSGAAMWAVN